MLTDRLIRVKYSGGALVESSLPEIYAALEEVDSFPALRPHQRHPWHAFVTQLGAMAMHISGQTQLPDDPADWMEIIRSLTAAEFPGDEPWFLVVPGLTDPAFMQTPASVVDRMADYTREVATPDELDTLLTSKNHDLKSAVASVSELDDWIFALVSLQTSEGFSGRGNYGISRMNGGLGCRPAFSITPSVRPGMHIRRDIVALLEHREKLLDDFAMQDGGARLLWTLAWDGEKGEGLPPGALDPFYIEVCRRVRLRKTETGLAAVRAISKAPRVAAKALKGRTGDPWTPFNIKEGKSLTLANGGFTYQRTADYLTSGNWERPPLCRLTKAEERAPQDMQLVARSLVRGQGKTEGYHERSVPLTPRVVRAFGSPTGMSHLGEIARDRIEQIKTIQRFLRHSVWTFASGGKAESVSARQRALATPWANKLDEIIDTSFFKDLQEEFGRDGDIARRSARNQWLVRTIEDARQILRLAQDSLPCPTAQTFRARVRSEAIFEGRIRSRHGFPDLFGKEEQDDGQ